MLADKYAQAVNRQQKSHDAGVCLSWRAAAFRLVPRDDF
jgi:hypothetical protein